MKKYIIICLLTLTALCDMVAGPRRCTEQDIPMDIRPSYVQQARKTIEDYYSQLPLNIGNPMVQEVFIKNFMQDGKASYMPEFMTNIKQGGMVEPEQYLQELDKLAITLEGEEFTFTPSDIRINIKDFYAPNMVSCYVKAVYKLEIKLDGKKLAVRECEAHCLFPRASVSIEVKVMQIQPIKGEDLQLEKEAVPKKTDKLEKTVDMPDEEPLYPSGEGRWGVSATNQPTVKVNTDKKSDDRGFFYKLLHPIEGTNILLIITLVGMVLWLIFEAWLGDIRKYKVWLYTIGFALGFYILTSLGLIYIPDIEIAVDEWLDKHPIGWSLFSSIFFGSISISTLWKGCKTPDGKWDWEIIGSALVLFVMFILSIGFLIYYLF